MTFDPLDAAIRAEYSVFGLGADKIVCSPDRLAEFADRVNSHLDAPVDQATISDRLITLRKRGAEKGGLPRIARAYHGRPVSK